MGMGAVCQFTECRDGVGWLGSRDEPDGVVGTIAQGLQVFPRGGIVVALVDAGNQLMGAGGARDAPEQQVEIGECDWCCPW